jgi:hypothetical protein
VVRKKKKIENQELDRHASGPQKTRLVHKATHGVVSAASIQKSSKTSQRVYIRVRWSVCWTERKNYRGELQRKPNARSADQTENSATAGM